MIVYSMCRGNGGSIIAVTARHAPAARSGVSGSLLIDDVRPSVCSTARQSSGPDRWRCSDYGLKSAATVSRSVDLEAVLTSHLPTRALYKLTSEVMRRTRPQYFTSGILIEKSRNIYLYSV